MKNSNIIYLDNSSTTAVCDTAIKYINRALNGCYGNPSSLHRLGMEAECEISLTRDAVAKLIHCRPDEVFFTGCGTESNNTAILGAAYSLKKRGNRIVTTTVEHPSVLRTMDKLESEGFEVIRLKPEKNGSVSEEALNGAINEKTVLVSIMLVNNETGAFMPVGKIKNIIQQKGSPALLHCDAVQAFGKTDIDVTKLGIDLLSASGHKIHGPKGIGVLYKNKTVHIKPLLLGGGQENGMRSGTESVPLIMGLRGAIEELPLASAGLADMGRLIDYARKKFAETGIIEINSPADALPYIINISVVGYRSETLLHFLEAENIFVSSGSACAKGKGSYVLHEMDLPMERIDSALRISLCRYTTESDIDALCTALINAAGKCKRSRK